MRDAMPGVPEQQDGVATMSWRETPYHIDLLFVLDDSPAMQPFAAALAQEMRIVEHGLRPRTGVNHDLHIGVITSDVVDEQSAPSEPIPGSARVGATVRCCA